jgi:hypothetical protein
MNFNPETGLKNYIGEKQGGKKHGEGIYRQYHGEYIVSLKGKWKHGQFADINVSSSVVNRNTPVFSHTLL